MADPESSSTIPTKQFPRNPSSERANPRGRRRSTSKIVAISRRGLSIKQVQLAEIIIRTNELERLRNSYLSPTEPEFDVAESRRLLEECMDRVQEGLLAGATIAEGSHFAWIEKSLVVDAYSISQLCTKLFVR